MNLQTLRTEHRDTILHLAAAYGASNVRVFGSLARGEADTASDIDLLVDLAEDRSLLDLGDLLMDLQEHLPKPVDVLTLQSLRHPIRMRVLQEAVVL